jgi:DnaJ-class molecular chaperone
MVVTKLNAKTQSYDVGGGFGSLEQCDVAAACKGLSDLQEALIYFYGCGQNGYRQYLVHQAEIELERVKCDLAERLSYVLIDDLYNSACKSCNGTGLNRHVKSCGDCKGGGRNTLSVRKLAELCGVPKSTFHDKHLKKYQEVYVRFEKMAYYTIAQVRQKLG